MGGFIYVTTGLLENRDLVRNEAQLFNVLAHEVGHLDLRHIALVIEQMERFGFRFDDPNQQLDLANLLFLLRQAYSKEREAEADLYAYEKMKAIGYSNLQVADRWQQLGRNDNLVENQAQDIFGLVLSEASQVFQSHPHAQERSCNYFSWLRESPPNYEKAYIGTANFENRISAFEQLY